MNKALIFISLLMSSLQAFAQAQRLSNGQKDKIFKTGSVYKLTLDRQSCDDTELIGHITHLTKDSLTLQVAIRPRNG